MIVIVSGGQTGADRGGLDAAIKLGIEHGGWCPKGRRAEDGEIPAKYRLRETTSNSYILRTKKNVVDSDTTLIFTFGEATGGSKKTVEFAQQYSKTYYHVNLNGEQQNIIERVRTILTNFSGILNIAGSRESKSPGIAKCVEEILCTALEKL